MDPHQNRVMTPSHFVHYSQACVCFALCPGPLQNCVAVGVGGNMLMLEMYML